MSNKGNFYFEESVRSRPRMDIRGGLSAPDAGGLAAYRCIDLSVGWD
jgi:hypothetical protein